MANSMFNLIFVLFQVHSYLTHCCRAVFIHPVILAFARGVLIPY